LGSTAFGSTACGGHRIRIEVGIGGRGTRGLGVGGGGVGNGLNGLILSGFRGGGRQRRRPGPYFW
jgi:hypothetical protein